LRRPAAAKTAIPKVPVLDKKIQKPGVAGKNTFLAKTNTAR
jgi:hypothetical protein